jgi:hypothetical protein
MGCTYEGTPAEWRRPRQVLESTGEATVGCRVDDREPMSSESFT